MPHPPGRYRRLAFRVAAGLAALLVVCVAAIGVALWQTLPPRQQTLHPPGLGHPVSITLDAAGIPRIEASSAEDAASALGFMHARDRMFQMELMRRVGSGRLAELAGPAALPLDRMMRGLGLRRRAEAAYPVLPAADRRLLEAYARGVNAEIAARGRFISPEFLLLGAPEPWTPVDELLWGRLMALSLGANWRTELARLGLSAKMPLARQLALQPVAGTALSPQAALTVPGLARLAADLDRRLPRFPAPYTLPEEASDEWAVDGAHSLTGSPLLAGDPHLAFGFPAIWYLARIDRPGTTLVGATAPGAPFLVIGQNGHIAWTFTSNEADTQDLFIEHPGPNGSYLTPDGPRPFLTRHETIHVRGAADDMLTIRETRHGPVISDMLPDPHGPLLAVSMEALHPTSPSHDDAAAGLIALDDATTIEQAGAAAAVSIAPVQNLLVADRTRIAQFTTGIVPIRKAGDGSFPVDGADGRHDWIGEASGDSLPHVVAPASGHLLNGNERTAPADFPVYMGRDWPDDWRARRIRSLLASRPLHDVAGFERMQVDTVSSFAIAILPQLQARLAPIADEFSARALAELKGWDGSMSARAPQPLIFNAWMQRFATDMLARNGIDEAVTGPWPDFVAFLLSDAGAPWCGGSCTPALLHALDEVTAQLAVSQGNDPAGWRWSRAHHAIFDNAFLRAIPLINHFARRSVAVSGDETTLLRAGGSSLGSFEATHGGAYRGVYDLADPERSRFIVTPGQSGNWLSSHAWNLMQDWASGASMTIQRRPSSVSATANLLP